MQRKLYRSREHGLVGGVASGMAEWLGVPIWLMRVLWLAAFLPGGIPGGLLYLLCWLLIPKAPVGAGR